MGGVVSVVYLLGSWGFSQVDVVVGYFEGSSGLTQLEVEVVQVVDEDE
jgi:hypothetical protein